MFHFAIAVSLLLSIIFSIFLILSVWHLVDVQLYLLNGVLANVGLIPSKGTFPGCGP